MSFVPSKSVVMGWNPTNLAEFLRKMNLSGSDKVVLKFSMNGNRFVNMSENDLQKFPKLQAPMISKICSEINKKEEKRGIFNKRLVPKYQEPEMHVEGEGWDDDEFESDDDYEDPDADEEDDVGDYESPTEEDEGEDGAYEPPPSESTEELAHKLCPSLPIGDGDYIDKNPAAYRGPPPAISPRPPGPNPPAQLRPLLKPSPQRRDPSHPSGRSPCRMLGPVPSEPPPVFRGEKPTRDRGAGQSPKQGRKFNTVPQMQLRRPPDRSQEHPGWPKPPVPPLTSSLGRSSPSVKPPPGRLLPDVRNMVCADLPLPPRPSLPSVLHPPPLLQHTQDLDSRWYVGKVTRSQAEHCLKQVNKDGAYLVRDSIRQQHGQPFTLMVLYQDKVYNIQIRQHNHRYELGTGLKRQETFPTVYGIISYYSHSPLLLIDAKNRSSCQQNQCLLSDPAGYRLA